MTAKSSTHAPVAWPGGTQQVDAAGGDLHHEEHHVDPLELGYFCGCS
jgi:hypothetical protein